MTIFPQLYHRNAINYYTIGILAYNYEINPEWLVKPSVLVRGHRSSPVQSDLNVMGMWRKMVWVQIGYRTNKSMIFSLGVDIKNTEIDYAYQMNNNEVSNISDGTHEVQLVYNFGSKLFKKE